MISTGAQAFCTSFNLYGKQVGANMGRRWEVGAPHQAHWPLGRGSHSHRLQGCCCCRRSVSVSWNYGHDLAIMLLKYARHSDWNVHFNCDCDSSSDADSDSDYSETQLAGSTNCKTFDGKICLRDKNKIVHLK